MYISPVAALSVGDTRGGGLIMVAELVATCGMRGARIKGAPAGVGDRSWEIPAVRGEAAVRNRGASENWKSTRINDYIYYPIRQIAKCLYIKSFYNENYLSIDNSLYEWYNKVDISSMQLLMKQFCLNMYDLQNEVRILIIRLLSYLTQFLNSLDYLLQIKSVSWQSKLSIKQKHKSNG